IKDVSEPFWRIGSGLHRQVWFWLLQLMAPAGFAIVALIVRQRERLAADPRLLRFRQAGRRARHALADLRGRSGDGARFYDELAAAMTSYLGAKLDLPPGAVEYERVVERLGRNGSSDQLGAQVKSLFDLFERARYAPNAGGMAE